MLKKSTILIFIRALSLFLKFLFVFFLGKFASNTAIIGEYGIIVSTVGISMFLLGFEFHISNNREIAKSAENPGPIIKKQFSLYKWTYSIILPIIIICCYFTEFVPKSLFVYLIVLIILEHWALENHRIINALKRPILASVIFGFKNIAWLIISFIDYFFVSEIINLKRYLMYWALTTLIGDLVGFYKINQILEVSIFKLDLIKYSLKKEILMASLFMLSSMSFLVINFCDRYMLDFYTDKNIVGVYTIYYQFTNAIEQIIASVLVVIFVPKLVEFHNNKSKEFFRELRKFNFLVVGFAVLGPVIITIAAPYIFELMDKASLISNIISLNILLVSGMFYGLSTIFHVHLYIQEKDKINISISVFAMLLNLLINWILIPKMGIYGASISTMATFFVLFVLKYIMASRNKFSLQKYEN